MPSPRGTAGSAAGLGDSLPFSTGLFTGPEWYRGLIEADY